MSKGNKGGYHYEYEGKKGKALPTIIVSIVVLALAVFFLANKTDILDGIIGGSEIVKDNGKEVAMDKDFAKGLRLASLERYDEAISYFEKVNFNRLNEDDQQLVLMTYLYSGNEQKALDLNKEVDEEIIRVFLKNDDLEKLKELETDSNLIAFEIAVLDNDYETIIELKDAERLEKDSRRANAIANAYYQLDQTEEAVNFTALMASSGVNMWEAEQKVINDNQQTLSPEETTKENKSSFLGVLLLFVFIIAFVFLIYLVIVNRKRIMDSFKKTELFKRQVSESEAKLATRDNEEDRGELSKTSVSSEDGKYSYHYNEK